ncbi:hypothetical protein [Paraburkholderia nodosa]|nr:hypothetical protein [Paraburkholderia nodosa]
MRYAIETGSEQGFGIGELPITALTGRTTPPSISPGGPWKLD